jgi:tetratricopeptide (TPR) repeat protein
MGAMDPERLKRRFQQGAELVEAGKLDAAIAAFTEIVQEQPDLEDVYPVLCELHLRAERRDIPQSWVTRGIGRNPSFRDAFLEMARGCEVLFDALPLLHGIAEALPEDAEIWSELGRIQAELNLHDEAERSLQRAISLGRTDAETAARLADLHDATGAPRRRRVSGARPGWRRRRHRLHRAGRSCS